jgi:hypothetical protein
LRIANRDVTVFRAGHPPLFESAAESLVWPPLVFFTAVRTLDEWRVNFDRLLADVVVALIGIAVLADVSPHLFFESVAVNTFDRCVVIGQ